MNVRRTKIISFRERVLTIPFNIIPNSHHYVVLLMKLAPYDRSDSELVTYRVGSKLVRGTYVWFAKRLQQRN